MGLECANYMIGFITTQGMNVDKTSWFNPSLIVALLALWIAWHNYRRNNFAIIRIKHSENSEIHSVHEGSYSQFKIIVQNLGVPLFNLKMVLFFAVDSGLGRASLTVPANGNKAIKEGQFAKGMITEFAFKTHHMAPEDCVLLSDLKDIKKQRAVLCLYADEFFVWKYRLHRGDTWIKRKWNRFATYLNLASLRRSKKIEGNKFYEQYLHLPLFNIPATQLIGFLKLLNITEIHLENPSINPPKQAERYDKLREDAQCRSWRNEPHHCSKDRMTIQRRQRASTRNMSQ